MPPEDVLWTAEPTLFAAEMPPRAVGTITVPKSYLDVAKGIACHRDEAKWALLYRVLFRIVNGERHLLEIESDPDVSRLYTMQKQIHARYAPHEGVCAVSAGGRSIYRVASGPTISSLTRMAPWFAERFGSHEMEHPHAGSKRALGSGWTHLWSRGAGIGGSVG